MTVQEYETTFFRGSDLRHIDEHDRPVIIAHFLHSLGKATTLPMVRAAKGITEYLDDSQLGHFTQLLLSRLIKQADEQIEEEVLSLLNSEYLSLSAERKGLLLGTVQKMKQDCERHYRPQVVEMIECYCDCIKLNF